MSFVVHFQSREAKKDKAVRSVSDLIHKAISSLVNLMKVYYTQQMLFNLCCTFFIFFTKCLQNIEVWQL